MGGQAQEVLCQSQVRSQSFPCRPRWSCPSLLHAQACMPRPSLSLLLVDPDPGEDLPGMNPIPAQAWDSRTGGTSGFCSEPDPEGLDSFFAFQPPMPLIPSTCLVMGVRLCYSVVSGLRWRVDHTRRRVEPPIVRFRVDPHCGAEGIEQNINLISPTTHLLSFSPTTPSCS